MHITGKINYVDLSIEFGAEFAKSGNIHLETFTVSAKNNTNYDYNKMRNEIKKKIVAMRLYEMIEENSNVS